MKEVLKAGTLKNYYTTEKYLKFFMKDRYNSADVYLSKLDYKFITDFEFYLRKNPIKKEDPCTTNGVMKHLERLKKTVSWAVNLKLISENPFNAYKLRFKSFERGYLEMDELKRVEGLELKNYQIEYVRDLFVFGCYTGLSYADAITLRPINIETDKDGTKWINTLRQKNKLTQRNIVPVVVPLLQPTKAIIEKYKDDPRNADKGTLFPPISNQEVNRCLKVIAGISGITTVRYNL